MFKQFFTQEYLVDFFYSIIRMATPLIYCSMGALISKQAGVTHMALEGIMLMASLVAVIFSAWTHTVIFGLVGAIIGGFLISCLLAYMHLKKDADLTLTGIALNSLSSGLTVYILFLLTGEKGTSRLLKSLVVPKWNIPIIKDIPIIGDIFSGHNILTYVSFIITVIVYFLVFRSRTGLRIRAVGFNPQAASSVGIDVNLIKFEAFVLSGLFASIGGAFMSMGYLSNFARDMIAGRGFIGMSATNLADGNVLGTLLASLGFSSAEAVSITLSTLNMKAELVGMIPYLATVVGLVIMSARKMAKAKKAQGL